MSVPNPDTTVVEMVLLDLSINALLDVSFLCRSEHLPVKMYVLYKDKIHNCRILSRNTETLYYMLKVISTKYGHTFNHQFA